MPLNKEITSKKKAAEVLELSALHLPEWDEVNLLTALHRIARLGSKSKF